MEPLTFDSAEPIEVPVTIGGKQYVLLEASESAATKYKDARIANMRVAENPDGTRTSVLGKVSEAESVLTQACLFELKDGTKLPISLGFVRGLPYRISSKLFKTIEQISQLDEDENTAEALDKKIKELQDKRAKIPQKEQSEKNS